MKSKIAQLDRMDINGIKRVGLASSDEAARHLGISRQSVHNGIREGRIPAKKLGRLTRVPWHWLLEQSGD
jgi:excisionase family DNA binding protein